MQTILNHAADILLMCASLGAAAYCMILSQRLKKLGSFDKGIGSAIAVMSAQVEEMKAALKEAKTGSDEAGRDLGDLVRQAREISAELEMMIAACHDFAETAIEVQSSGRADPAAYERAADQAMSAIRNTTSDSRAAEPDPREEPKEDAAPVFGSRRRRTGEVGADVADEAPAVFRHRQAVDA